jgi:hypothetical protein
MMAQTTLVWIDPANAAPAPASHTRRRRESMATVRHARAAA